MIDFTKRLLARYKKLHIDIETYSSVDFLKSGHYKYSESIDFEILMLAYAFDNNPVKIVDLAAGEEIPEIVICAFYDPNIKKCAHNAAFERICLSRYGYVIPIEEWECTMIKAAYCGLPLKLEQVGDALEFAEDKKKKAKGKALIRYFCSPCKPTKVNGQRTRNFYYHAPEKWEEFKDYCKGDVVAEVEIDNTLDKYELPEFEQQNYVLDQKINDRGVLIDLPFVKQVIKIYRQTYNDLFTRLQDITGLENPNSAPKLKEWLTTSFGKNIDSLTKDSVIALISEIVSGVTVPNNPHTKEVLEIRQKMAKTSIKKYATMIHCACEDGRARGLFQFYGANRTGRWAGRLIQLQNLPRNYLGLLELTRELVSKGDIDTLRMLYDDLQDVLSQLIRTAFVAPENKTLCVSDFSAIEARVTAWLAGEQWRLDVFNSHGKIYEASASKMFNIPIENITKDSEYRQKGKVAELALGYGGSVGALTTMEENTGVPESERLSGKEKKNIVRAWRAANVDIVSMWKNFEVSALIAVKGKKQVTSKYKNIVFEYDGQCMTIQLPSGRKLYYWKPIIMPNKFDRPSVWYYGIDTYTRKWQLISTYGGKLTENIVQAVSRDLLAVKMQQLDSEGYDLRMHVHDEAVAEVKTDGTILSLGKMNTIMGEPVEWTKGLPLKGAGFISKFYKK